MNSEIKVYSYPNGEIQRVQVVRWDDWSQLDFLCPSFSEASLDCFSDIYKNFLVPACPWIFGQMVMFQLPEDVTVPVTEGTTDRLTAAAMVLKEGVKLVGGNPRFSSSDAESLWRELEKKDSIRIIRGKLPFTQIIPVGNFAGYLSEVEPEAALKVNSSFFIMDPIDCATIYDQVGTVLGLCVKDGVVQNPPMYGREALLVGKDGSVSVRPIDVRDLEIEIHGKCYKHGENAWIYSRPERKRVRVADAKRASGILGGEQANEDEKSHVLMLVIVGNRVVAVKDSGSVEIPASGFVMCVEDGICASDESVARVHTMISPGDVVIYHGLEDVQFGIQVGNSIMRDGVKTDGFISRFYNIYHLEPVPFPPSLYPMDFEKARAARIALGADKDGKPMLFWAEGAAKFGYVPGEGSCGASLSEMAEIAADLGMVNGVNLDGGGSAQVLLHNKRELLISDRKKKTTVKQRD